MNTIFIFNSGFEEPLQYFVLEGDYQHLHGTFIGLGDQNGREDELCSILDYEESGRPKVSMLETFPVQQISSDTRVIEVGIIP